MAHLKDLVVDGDARIIGNLYSSNGGGGGTDLNVIFDRIYPVGSIYMSVSPTNPGELFVGTWVEWGSGQVPVGVKTTDTDFATVEKTGGAKTASTNYTPAGKNTGAAVTAHTYTPAGSVSAHKHGSGTLEALIGSPRSDPSGIGFKASNINATAVPTYEVRGSWTAGSVTASHNTALTGSTAEATPTFTGTKATLSHTVTQPTFTGTQASITESTVQPYITCYMWKRTA